MSKPQRLGKKDFLAHWSRISSHAPLRPQPVAYKHEGSTYDQDGIRITGSRQFLDGVLSRLKELLCHENTQTRLQVNYTQAVDKKTQQPIDSWVCYIQVHERGGEAKMVNAFASAISGKETILSRGY